MTDDNVSPDRPLLSQPVWIALKLLAVFFLTLMAADVSVSLPREGMLAPVWVANAVALAALIRAPRKHWPLLILAAAAANFTSQLGGHVPIKTSIFLIVANIIEYVTAAYLFHQIADGQSHLAKGRTLLQLAIACSIGVVASTVISAMLLYLTTKANTATITATWALAHGLGLFTVTPCLLIIGQPRRYLTETALNWRTISSPLILLATSVAVFSQTRFPILFLIPPALLFVSLELGVFGAAAGVLAVEAVAIGSLYLRTGPMMLIHGSPIEKAAVVQVFLLAALLSSIPVAVLNARPKLAISTAITNELKYRLLAENARDMIAQFQPGGEITFITASSVEVLGYKPEDLIGRRALEFAHPDDLDSVRTYYAALRQTTGYLPDTLQFRMQHRDGHWVWLEGQPRMFFDPQTGAVTEMQDVVRDITRRKELEIRLTEAEAQASAASRAKGEFLSNMSHELRTPLTSILGFTSLLNEETGLGEQVLRSISRISTSSQALLSIVNDVLDFSKLEAGQVEIHATPIDLHALFAETLGAMEPQAHAKLLQLQLIADNVPHAGLVDDVRLRQVLTNLIGNAIKFTASGSVTLTARYADNRLRCEITDTGVGVSQEALSRLFQRFSQADASTTRMHGGTGLGLAICKGLIEAMDGEIGADSCFGEGSTFWFEFPCTIVQAPAKITAATAKPAFDLQGLRILVADDNKINREIIRLLLAPTGVDITEAADGQEALDMAQQAPFDLILMDVRMPTMDGDEAAKAIRLGGGPNDGVPILAFTADVLDLAVMETPESPFDGRIEKPIKPETLVAAISQWARPVTRAEPLEVAHG